MYGKQFHDFPLCFVILRRLPFAPKDLGAPREALAVLASA
jgi:hypothetical protein